MQLRSNRVQTAFKPRANRVQTACKSRANRVQTAFTRERPPRWHVNSMPVVPPVPSLPPAHPARNCSSYCQLSVKVSSAAQMSTDGVTASPAARANAEASALAVPDTRGGTDFGSTLSGGERTVRTNREKITKKEKAQKEDAKNELL